MDQTYEGALETRYSGRDSPDGVKGCKCREFMSLLFHRQILCLVIGFGQWLGEADECLGKGTKIITKCEEASGMIIWSSDGSVAETGWKFCPESVWTRNAEKPPNTTTLQSQFISNGSFVFCSFGVKSAQ
eukprot:6307651-Amphidinium_carterae.1